MIYARLAKHLCKYDIYMFFYHPRHIVKLTALNNNYTNQTTIKVLLSKNDLVQYFNEVAYRMHESRIQCYLFRDAGKDN